jgi:hypothetical protein
VLRARVILGGVIAAALLAGAGCHALFMRPHLEGEVHARSPSFELVTDIPAVEQELLLRVAEDMRAELERAFPLAPGAPPEGRREIVAFRSPEGFRRFLDAHLLGEERAIGFYCDLGRECAIAWRNPPGPEDVRVLRHELAHQHLAARFPGRIPGWLEEGLVEVLALDGPEPGEEWDLYRSHRFAADAVFAATMVHGPHGSWPASLAGAGTRAVPPPRWAAGEGGYFMHFLFVRFLESIGEGRRDGGALGRALAAAARGEEAALDLERRFATIGALEDAFDAYVVAEGTKALIAESPAFAPPRAVRGLEPPHRDRAAPVRAARPGPR